MNKQGDLLAVLEIILTAMAFATIVRQEICELLKVTEEVLTLFILLMPLSQLLLSHLVNLAERQELVVVVRVALLQSAAKSIMHVEEKVELELSRDVEAIHQSSDCLHAVAVATTVKIHDVVNAVLLDFVLHD